MKKRQFFLHLWMASLLLWTGPSSYAQRNFLKRCLEIFLPQKVVTVAGSPKVFYEMWTGITVYPGLKTNVGCFMLVQFKSEALGEFRTYAGRVVNTYQAGLDLLNEATGEIISLNANYGEFGEVSVTEPSPVIWEPLYGGRQASFYFESNPGSVVLIHNYSGDKRYLLGRATKVTDGDDRIYNVVDRSGVTHRIDFDKLSFANFYTAKIDGDLNRYLKNLDTKSGTLEYPESAPVAVIDSASKSTATQTLEKFVADGQITMSEALSMKPTLKEPLQSVLTSEQYNNLFHNFELIGIIKKNYTVDTLGNFPEWQLLFYNGVTLMARTSAHHLDLAAVLLSKYSDVDELRRALDAWAVRNKIGYQFAFFDDVRRLGLAMQSLGNVAAKQSVINGNGFVIQGVYSGLIQKRIYPIADPHDVLSHLSSILEPQFVSDFNSFNQLMDELNVIIMNDPRPERDMVYSKFLKPRGYARLYDHLIGTVRDATHENWSYIVQGAAPELFLQGNASFNGLINGLLKNDLSQFSTDVLNLVEVTETFGSQEIQKLDGIEEFYEQPGMSDIYWNYIHELNRHALTPAHFARVKPKLDRFLRNATRFRNLLSPLSLNDAKVIIKKLAAFIERDPDLSYMYSREGREKLFSAALKFAYAYKKWLDTLPNDRRVPIQSYRASYIKLFSPR